MTKHTDHSHPHSHTDEAIIASPFQRLEGALRELFIEKGIITAEEIRQVIDVLDSRVPMNGSKIVARAWMDPAYKKRLLENGTIAVEELGFKITDDTKLMVVENTAAVHNVVVCTLCSCYPRAILGFPPEWYKNSWYRKRAVIEPRAVLREFGTIISDDVEIRVHDSTAEIRYLVLPLRPKNTENMNEEQLAELVTRDSMIGVTIVAAKS